MSLYSQFRTDSVLEKKGIELEYRTGEGDPSIIRIARAGGANARYMRVLDVKTKPYRRQIQTENITPEQMDAIMREVYADAVVLGWDNVTDENGEQMPFNRENCIKLFTDLPDLFADVQAQANKAALFKNAELEADAGN